MDTHTDAARVLDAVDDLSETMLAELCSILRVPSVSGTDFENDAQQHMSRLFDQAGSMSTSGRSTSPRSALTPTSPAWRSTAAKRGASSVDSPAPMHIPVGH